jgi:hypothetical protein
MRTGKSHAGRVNLTKYVKVRGTAFETWRFCPVVHASNGRIRPNYVLIDGRAELHIEGAYYIEWYQDGKRYRESVGKNPGEAFATAERKVQILRNRALGIEIVGEDKRAGVGVSLAEACRDFLEESRQHHRPKTYSQYKTALEYFLQSCREKPLASIERTDVMSFMSFLSAKGLERRTIWTKVQVVVSMLKANGVTKLIRKRDWPRYTQTETVPIDVRILAATNRDLEKEVSQATFRRDLYFRLDVLRLRIPPLRERRSDIRLLVAAFLEGFSRASGRVYDLSAEALDALMAHDWPGNVRELENCIARCCALNSGPTIHVTDLPSSVTVTQAEPSPTSATAIVPIARLERQAILDAMEQLNGDKLTAAKLLGIGKTTLYRKLKEYGVRSGPQSDQI